MRAGRGRTGGSCRRRSASAGSTRRWCSAQSTDERVGVESERTPARSRSIVMAVAAPTFTGFEPEAIQFLADLAANNERGWFQPRKAEYERLLKEPLEQL